MNLRELLEEFKCANNDKTIIVSFSYNPILFVKKSTDPAFVIDDINDVFRYDTKSEKIHFISCSREDWVKYFLKNNPNGTFDDFLKTIDCKTGHADPTQKKEAIEEYNNEFKKVFDLLVGTEIKESICNNFDMSKTYILGSDLFKILNDFTPKTYLITSVPFKIINNLELPVICDSYPVTYLETKEIYWDGYGRQIVDGKYTKGGNVSWKAVLQAIEPFDFMDNIVIPLKLRTFEDVMRHFDFSEMEESKRNELILKLKKDYEDCRSIWIEEMDYVDNLKKEGRELMTVNFLGPLIVPVPKGDCNTCTRWIKGTKNCELGENKKDECSGLKSGFKYYIPIHGCNDCYKWINNACEFGKEKMDECIKNEYKFFIYKSKSKSGE